MVKLRLAIAWLLISAMLYTTNCGGGSDNGLSLELGANQAFILPGDIVFDEFDNCYSEGTVSEPRFRVDTLKTQYTGTGVFNPVVVQIKVPEISGVISEYTCAISGAKQDTMGLFLGYGAAGAGDADGELEATDGQLSSICPIHCGGLTVSSTASFSVSATVKIIGIETTVSGSETVQKPLTTQTTLILRGLP